MRRAKLKRASEPEAGAQHPSVTGAEFLLSIVETHKTRRNGNVIGMDSGLKAQQELDKIEEQISRIESLEGQSTEAHRQIQQLHDRLKDLRREVASHLNAWERTNLARHPQRPYTLDYVERLFTDWSEIHGDRGFRDDPAIVCGMARFHGEEVVIVGQQKARDAKQRVYRNFGMPHPEGYRKSMRVMKIAEKFRRPIFTFVDSDGAYPGLHAEERGQGEAIARNLLEMSRLKVPIITTVIGVGGSGGALAIAVADRVLMMENSVYSVISPEGCASIMWRDASKKELAAEAMKITAKDMTELGCVDGIIPEPPGGAHTDHARAAELLDEVLQKQFAEIKGTPTQQLLEARYQKFRKMAQFFQVEG
ncbi:MAG TPA: acetyl-CoA carboxylase carboxyltransferase subunit alpha [Terriglobales bacterium]|nr:acetyl-CoA carboxylase carboxyltransferase subunit alpha [Terriglobales bacterium]